MAELVVGRHLSFFERDASSLYSFCSDQLKVSRIIIIVILRDDYNAYFGEGDQGENFYISDGM